MYEEPLLMDEQISDSIAVEGNSVDASDNYSQEAVKSKKEEDNQYTLNENRLILRWGLVFTFFR
jgi:hypothetical protein